MTLFVPSPRAIREIDDALRDVTVRKRANGEAQRELCRQLADLMVERADLAVEEDSLLARRTETAERLRGVPGA